MSSSYIYNPKPTRAWSRVQNQCTYDSSNNYASGTVYMPLTKQTVSLAQADYENKLLLKGNILQYKKNSSNLTKNQRYTQIAKGMWTNRTKTWATQSDTYSNPNTTSLQRVNYSILNPSNNAFTNPPSPFNCPSKVILDGGNLLCNTTVNPCTGEIIKRTISQRLCNPTSSSDVPGPIQELCWNDGYPTWYPRQRYIMTNSGTSFPEGYKGFVSASSPDPPILSGYYINNDVVTLSWTFKDNDCIPISSFNVYQNGILIQTLLYPLHNTIINVPQINNYSFYVTALSTDIESAPSNIFKNVCPITITGTYSVNIDAINTNITLTSDGTITFSCNTFVNMIGVGGGGGGGGANDNTQSSIGAGGGGGGQVINHIFNSGILPIGIVIGQGGNGGWGYNEESRGNGNDITPSTSTTITIGSTIYTAYGGGGGKSSHNGGAGGTGGSGGGNGGAGANFENSPDNYGLNGENGSFEYSGGGGGGINIYAFNYTDLQGGGLAGRNGIGGRGGSNIPTIDGLTGQSAKTYGSGGGGGGATRDGYGYNVDGGAGYKGVVIFKI